MSCTQAVPSPSPQRSKKKLPTFGGGGEKCQACGKNAYQAERTQVGSYFFHVSCMRCAKCGPSRHLGSEYGLAANAEGVICLYCAEHELDAKQNFPQPAPEDDGRPPKPADVVAELRAAESRAAHEPRAPAAEVASEIAAAPKLAVGLRGADSPGADVPPADAPAAAVAKAGLGTAEDRALEEAIKRTPRAALLDEAPADKPADTNPFARCSKPRQTSRPRAPTP